MPQTHTPASFSSFTFAALRLWYVQNLSMVAARDKQARQTREFPRALKIAVVSFSVTARIV